jgi:hypothetical protein
MPIVSSIDCSDDDEPVADQLIVAHALHDGDVFDARRGRCRGRGAERQKSKDSK